jgi:hypothetical protein
MYMIALILLAHFFIGRGRIFLLKTYNYKSSEVVYTQVHFEEANLHLCWPVTTN